MVPELLTEADDVTMIASVSALLMVPDCPTTRMAPDWFSSIRSVRDVPDPMVIVCCPRAGPARSSGAAAASASAPRAA
jgi:hypothetical protein